MTNIDLNALCETAKSASLKAGKAIMEIYNNVDFGIEQKDDKSPLTLADKAGHRVIMEELSIHGLPVLSEEGRNIPFDERKGWDYFWMVDPLDGTKEFIKRNGEFTVNIALIHNQQSILGVVYAPALDIMYWGFNQSGAWKQLGNEAPVNLKSDPDNNITTIVASRSHMSKETEDFINQYPEASTISMGSSLKFMLVAEGSAQVYPRFAPTMEWDTAAAQAVVESSGGEVLCYPELVPMKYNRENMLNGWFLCRK